MSLSSRLARLFIGDQAAPTLLDLRAITDDIFAAAELAGPKPFVIQVPIAHCRSRIGSPYAKNGPNPLTRTARAYVEGRISGYRGSPLEEYAQNHQPKNAAERLALSGVPSLDLVSAPPYNIILPWQRIALAEAQKRALRIKKRERRRHAGNLRMKEFFLSAVEKDGILELLRITKLVDSIRRSGYLRTNAIDGDITAKLIIRPGEGVRYILASGRHRAAALAALGFEYIPIRLRFHTGPSVERVVDWPHVRDGLYTSEQAVEFFNRIWHGQPPPGDIPAGWRD